jgi:hypothetical protein
MGRVEIKSHKTVDLRAALRESASHRETRPLRGRPIYETLFMNVITIGAVCDHHIARPEVFEKFVKNRPIGSDTT